MHVLTLFDNRTLVACISLLATVFSIAFFGMKRAYPNLVGAKSIATSFVLAIPGTVLIASRGSVSYFISVMVANFFIFASFIFLYRGILRLIGSRRTILMP